MLFPSFSGASAVALQTLSHIFFFASLSFKCVFSSLPHHFLSFSPLHRRSEMAHCKKSRLCASETLAADLVGH